jgi:precorrin-2 dehydrogenase/sirohydrochlorin ferrochelatase
VTVISPSLTAELERLVADGSIEHRCRRYQPGDLKGAFLAYAATDDDTASAAIAGDAEAQGVLLNSVDQPAYCSFIVPAVVERGDLLIATSTSGASPMMARRIRERLESEFGSEYAEALAILGSLRQRLGREGRGAEERRRIFAALVDSPLLDLLQQGDGEGVDRLLAQTAGSEYTRQGLLGS